MLQMTQASIQLSSTDKATRLVALRALAESNLASTKTLLLGVLAQKNGQPVEPDAEVRTEAEKALYSVQSRLSTGEMVGRVFSGISLGSILLLAALGLAITYGLMGVINMAHGELIMIGAYTTYMVQNALSRAYPCVLRCLPDCRGAGVVRCLCARRHGARADGDPLSLRPPA